MKKAPENKSKYYFDRVAADTAINFFEKILRHTTGKWAGAPFVLEPWQRQFVETVFGWKRKADGLRRYRIVYCEIPKKNGKSTFAAGVALYLLLMDNEPKAEVYSAAGDREQAAIVFDIAAQMAAESPEIEKRTKIYKRSIFAPASFSKYAVINAEAGTKHGINPSGIIFDELHVQKSGELWDTLVNGVATRDQPLVIAITTAGWDRTSICWDQHEYAKKVIDGVIEDDEFLGIIYAAEPEDEWNDPATWKKANPGYGVTIKAEYFANVAARAARIPARIDAFKRLHLNIWTDSVSAWIMKDDWNSCEGGVTLESMAGRTCFAGLDLGSTKDITALSLVFPPDEIWKKWIILLRFYMPADRIKIRNDESHGNYLKWKDSGYLITTPGDVTDYDFIREDLKQLAENIYIEELAIDRWNATQISTQLIDDGLDVVPYGQGWQSMTSPTKELERLIISKKIVHSGDPVLAWMVSNVAIQSDAAGNMKPDKGKSAEKIDGVVAVIMALGRAMVADPDDGSSIYDDSGIMFS